MSYDDERPRGREPLMERRLRRARGEEVDEEVDDYGGYDDEPRRALPGGYGPPRPAYGSSSPGCAQAGMVFTLGVLALLLLGGFVIYRAIGGVGSALQPPPIAQILATPTPEIISGAAVVQRVRQLSRLETSSYTVETVIEVNQSQGNPIFDFFAGDALLLIAHGTVVAGVDLGALAPDAVAVSPDGRTVTLRLPPAQVFSTSLDNSRTRVYSRDRGWFAPENPNLESLARQEAEARILQSACEDGILSKATAQAETALRQFLGLLDDVEVVIVPAAPAGCAAPAATPAP
jgi:hypothetical protein